MRRAGDREHVAVEARERALAGAVAEHAVAADAVIDDAVAAALGKTLGE